MTLTTQNSAEILDRQFLEIRCELLNVAAALDRLERAAGFADLSNDPRVKNIQAGLRILLESGSDRAEHLQMQFSDQYVSDWQNG